MLFARKHNEYGCPMCGRLPITAHGKTVKYRENRRTLLMLYRIQCPKTHITTSWFSRPELASRQWKELVDEYKGKDTK